MLVSDMGESKLKVFSGNTLRIPCHILFLYETSSTYSAVHRRLNPTQTCTSESVLRADADTRVGIFKGKKSPLQTNSN